ncbi:MAG: MBL fold metallo-hydrolase [Acidobacteria bacterium]|nr:MBL fold metallo-hydrolase [Acidobacteriota bacterium]
MLRICVMGSGSGGNATYVGSEKTHLLIDFGLSTRRVAESLLQIGVHTDDIQGVVISHEHTDHVKGLTTFTRRFCAPIFLSRPTLEALTGVTINGSREIIEVGMAFRIGDLDILPFPVSHDAADPAGFLIRHQGMQVAHVTDLGCITEAIRYRVQGSDVLIIESNHDEEMLKIGPYPWPLKQRVLSRLGHLSNRDLAAYLQNDFDGRARTIVLAHLSQKNNHPELARLSAQEALAERSAARSDSFEVILAQQDTLSPVITIG